MRERVPCKLLLSYTIKYYQYNYSRKSDASLPPPFCCWFGFVCGWGSLDQRGLTGKSSSLSKISTNTVLMWNELKMLALLH